VLKQPKIRVSSLLQAATVKTRLFCARKEVGGFGGSECAPTTNVDHDKISIENRSALEL
jgi:hypothetical protein